MEESNREIRVRNLRLNLVLTEIFLTILGTLLAVAISLDIQRERDRFAESTLYLRGHLDTLTNRNLIALHGLAALLKVKDIHDTGALSTYTRFVLTRHPYIHRLEVAEAVPNHQMNQFISEQREAGAVDFKLKRPVREGAHDWLEVGGYADVFYPLVFIEPMLPEVTEEIGTDLGAMSFSRGPLLLAEKSNTTTASRAFRLNRNELGYMLIQPVERGDKQLFAILVSKVTDFIPPEVSRQAYLSVSIVYQNSAQPDPVSLFRQEGRPPDVYVPSFFPTLHAEFTLGGRDQSLNLTVERQLDWSIVSWRIVFGILAGSFLMVPIMGAYSRAHHRNEMSRLESNNTLFYQANFDALTGLPNRQLFMNRLEQAMAVAHRQGLMHAVLYLDLDGFKGINDYYGHLIGDKVLVRAARIFSRCVREIDTVARLGGDEFVILLQNIDGRVGADFVAAKIRKAFRQPPAAATEGGKVPPILGTSIGIAIYPEDGTTIPDLLKVADEDMYRDKASRKTALHSEIAALERSRVEPEVSHR